MVERTGDVRLAWERGTARVLHEGRPVGVAFLIPDGLLLTCAHVLAPIAGLADSEPLPPGLPVTVDFPLLPGRPQAETTVHFSVPVAADNSGDVAVLQLTGQPPAGVLPMRIVEADDLAGHRWRTFGFPRCAGQTGDKDAGVWTRGTIEGREGTGWWQLTCDEGAGFALAGGFSGAPVWDEEYRGVIGVVVAVEGDQRRRTGYALTVESLAHEWPQLRSRLLADSPYRELLAFTERDSAVFHGRAGETRRLLELLEEQQVPVLPVFGASGVGKSSLVGAGLLARIDRGSHLVARLPHGLRLTAEELLAWALASAGDADTAQADWHERWSALTRQLAEQDGLRTALEQTLARHDGRSKLLLVADQFETLLADAPDTARKLDVMLGALTVRRTDGSRPAQAVVVTRIDFLPQTGQLPVLSAAWEATHVVVPPMTRDQLREVITRPLAGHAGVRFADGLVERIVQDTPHGAAALPVLEYTLSQLWARQERGTLTAGAYQELGGVEGALVGNAERSLWAWADESEHEALERIFIQLVRPAEQLDAGERGPDTRRVADRTEFAERDWTLVHRLASTRLVVVTRRPTGLDTAELAHQALVENWPRLRTWVERNRDFRSWQERLRHTARAWQEQDRSPALALDRRRIEEARRWLAARPAEISAEEAGFVEASAEVQHRRTRRRRLAVTGFAVLMVLVLVASVLAYLNARTSDEQRNLATAERLTRQSQLQAAADPALAARLALAAHHIGPAPETRTRLLGTVTTPLRATITGHTGSVGAVAFSPDGTSLVTSSSDGTVRLWDPRTRRQQAAVAGQRSAVTRVAFSPGGDILATEGDARTVRLWENRTLRPLHTFPGTGRPVVFSPDGLVLATGGSEQGTVQLWDVRTHRLLATLTGHGRSSVLSAVFSSDGGTLVTSGSGEQAVRLWDVRTRQQVATFNGHTGPVQSMAISPDGKTLATGDNAATVRLWDLPARRSLATLTGHVGSVRALAFSPDGRTLVTGGEDRTLRVHDVPSRTGQVVLAGHTGPVNSVAFSPDGHTLASGGGEAVARLWDMRTGRPLVAFTGADGAGSAMAFSPGGQTLATAIEARVARLWEVRTHQQVATLDGHTGSVLSVAFSPDGNTLATGGAEDRAVRLWHAWTHQPLATLTGHTGVVSSVAFSPDGNTLATGSYADQTVRLWDARTHRLLTTLTKVGSPVVFSPDGGTLVTSGGTDSKTVRLWDVRTHRQLATFNGHTGLVGSAVFSPDGNTLATGSWDASVRLWDVRTHQQAATLTGHTDSVQSVAFSPDSTTLASSGRDAAVRLWDVRTREQVATLTGHTGIVWSVKFSPDGQSLATAGEDRTARLWDLRTHRLLANLTGHTRPLRSVMFSPDGNRLATSSHDATVRLWNTGMLNDLGALVQEVCAIAGGAMDEQEWQRHVPAEVPYRRTC
ncbi:trypsin-like peptidase domain-containing protein [Crossiella sp. CA-258035]|uniref:nSTAND1 domain-containing NTPase n=1 Tax=Crossiella sp. CA-258035 TaxID=2981138 RepID=UPI0024BCA29B|nr:trypsin-like peptidase domain-containing protein [Crossiella sp. CA-258035]WHT16157.1 trypsin-like peptidase domain-containing protein [Crossiella sp. CA-258035]